MTVNIVSVNVAQPCPIVFGRQEVLTGIFKRPVAGRVAVRRHNLAGDAQADLTVHGGEFKAVYAYPLEHYSYWEAALERGDLAPGSFGENLTTTGLLENRVCVGDVFRIGSAVLQITQPRLPCGKLAYKFGRPQIIKEFLWSGRSGFYLRVVEEGDVGEGDTVTLLRPDPNAVTVRQLLGITELNEPSSHIAPRAIKIESLPANWRETVAAMLESAS